MSKLRAASNAETWLSYTAVCPYVEEAEAEKIDNIQVHTVSQECFMQLCNELSVRAESHFSGILVKTEGLE